MTGCNTTVYWVSVFSIEMIWWFSFSSLDIVLKTMPLKLIRDILESELGTVIRIWEFTLVAGTKQSQGFGGDLNSGSGINCTVAIHTVFPSDTYICWEIKIVYVLC